MPTSVYAPLARFSVGLLRGVFSPREQISWASAAQMNHMCFDVLRKTGRSKKTSKVHNYPGGRTIMENIVCTVLHYKEGTYKEFRT